MIIIHRQCKYGSVVVKREEGQSILGVLEGGASKIKWTNSGLARKTRCIFIKLKNWQKRNEFKIKAVGPEIKENPIYI